MEDANRIARLPRQTVIRNLAALMKGSVLDIDRLSAQSHSPDMARKLRVEFAGAHHESW
jgi:hypothetical protein